jgi:serine O-acetyltransferase
MFDRIREDVRTVFAEDPAARTAWEVLTCYPGLHAIWLHRVAHFLWRRKLFFLGRLLSQANRWLTGIEIHPGATIGRRFFVDHGMGVVIGETAEVGDDVLMYQGVVLGGTSLEKTKRHPTLGNHVVVGTGATILGPITVGDGARIGAGSVVIKPVPPGATIVGVPGHVAGAKREPMHAADLEHGKLPDPVLRTLAETLDRQGLLETRVRELEQALSQLQSPGPSPRERALSSTHEAGIRQALREVIDPDAGINVVDLGLVRQIALNGRGVEVHMVLCPGCTLAGHLVEQVRRKVRSVMGDEPVEVVLLDEDWNCTDAAFRLNGGNKV